MRRLWHNGTVLNLDSASSVYGAKTMVQDGLLENPHVDVAIALHVESLQKTATLEYFETDAYAGCATFRFDIHGVGGHSSQPQTTIDPLNCAYQIANALNLIIPLETDPEVFATLNVGVVQGGTAGNIIPS